MTSTAARNPPMKKKTSTAKYADGAKVTNPGFSIMDEASAVLLSKTNRII